MSNDTGGPAFQHITTTDMGSPILAGGMTLRDWFAGRAMSGIIAVYGNGDEFMCAKYAYEYADAMIAERNEP